MYFANVAGVLGKKNKRWLRFEKINEVILHTYCDAFLHFFIELLSDIWISQAKNGPAIAKVCQSQYLSSLVYHILLAVQLVDRLKAHLSKAFSEGIWTSNAKSIAESWLKSGLKTRCITRDLKWGTQVPLEGFTDKVTMANSFCALNHCPVVEYICPFFSQSVNPIKFLLTQCFASVGICYGISVC